MTVNTKRIAEFAKNNKPASASVLIFFVVFILLMAMNLSNIIDFARTYDEAVNLPSYADRNAYFAYDDILCQDMFCVEMEGMNEADATEYFNKSIPAIRERYKGFFISSSIIYTFIALLFGQYFMVKKNESCARKHYRDVLLGGVICWAVYIGIVFAVLLAKGFVMSLRTPAIILILIGQLLVMLSALAVYAWIIRRVRFKMVAALLLIALSVVFYFGGILSEIPLSYPKTVESFDYVSEIDNRYNDESYEGISYYDPQTHKLIIGEDVYDAQIVQNEKYVGGFERAALIAGEIANPLANINRFGFDMVGTTSVWVTLLYMAKSVSLIGLVGHSFIKEDSKKKTQ